MNQIILRLSKKEAITIDLNFKNIDFCCTRTKSYFISDQQLLISQQFAGSLFVSFLKKLKLSIENKLQLHTSLTQNLGFMWNELLQGKSGFFIIPTSDGSSKYWIGLNYYVCETLNNAKPPVTTWLYNDHHGNIIFEVSKTYKWSTQEDDLDDPEFMTYDEFIKDYKPLIQRVIPREVAILWVEQLMQVYKGFFTEEDFIKKCKEMGW